jgi:hypothetical protein
MKALRSIILGAALAGSSAVALKPPPPVVVEAHVVSDYPKLPATDPGFCGILGAETGAWDPHYKSGACPRHDDAMTAHKEGHPYQGNVETQLEFAGKVMMAGLWGAVAATTALPYALLGGVGGGLLWAIRDLRKKL